MVNGKSGLQYMQFYIFKKSIDHHYKINAAFISVSTVIFDHYLTTKDTKSY